MIVPPLVPEHYHFDLEFIILCYLFKLKDNRYQPKKIKITYLRGQILVTAVSPTLPTNQQPFKYPIENMAVTTIYPNIQYTKHLNPH